MRVEVPGLLGHRSYEKAAADCQSNAVSYPRATRGFIPARDEECSVPGERGGWAIVERFHVVVVTKMGCANDAVFNGIRCHGPHDAEDESEGLHWPSRA
jgi:hypothetical protein